MSSIIEKTIHSRDDKVQENYSAAQLKDASNNYQYSQ